MGNPEERLRLLASDTKSGALANLREEIRARLNAGTPRALADILFDLLEIAVAREAISSSNTHVSSRLSRASAAEKLDVSPDSGTFKNAVKRIEEVLGACRPDDYRLMPPEEDRIGVACIETVIGGELWLLIVRGPTSEARGESESPPLLRLAAEYRRLNPYKAADFHWNLRQTRNFVFTGRDDLFEVLDSNTGVEVAPRIDILVGLGGVGKSHICVEYAYRHRTDFDAIWWIRATDTTTIEEDLRSLAVDLLIADEQVPTPEAVSRVRVWLERNSRWLLIIDNAGAPDAIQSYVPAAGSGRTLITSLNPAWQQLGRVHEVLELPEQDATVFLERRSGLAADGSGALARQLGYLPLALEHAAAYIDAVGITNAEYLDLYRKNQNTLLKRQGSHLSPVVVTWMLSIERVQSQSSLGVRLLNVASHMAPAPIPKALFEAWVVEDLELNALQLNDAIAALRRYSLINARALDIVVHRLLQDVIRTNQKKEPRRVFQSTALRLVHDVFVAETFSFHKSALAARLLPHVNAVAAPERVASTDVAIHTLVGLAGYLDQRGDFEEVAKVLQIASERLSARTPPDLQLSVLTKLAGLQWSLGRSMEATWAFLRAFRVNEHFEPHGPGEFESKVEFLSTATRIALQTSDPRRALMLVQQAVEIAQQVELEPGMAARAYADMADVLIVLGRHNDAIRAAQIAVKLDREILGDAHPALALRLSVLGEAYEAAGRLRDARTAREEALAITRSAYGEDHTMTVRNCIHLADTLRRQRSYSAALELYNSAAMHSTILPLTWIAGLLEHRAETLKALRRYADAAADLDQAIALVQSSHFRDADLKRLRGLRGDIPS